MSLENLKLRKTSFLPLRIKQTLLKWLSVLKDYLLAAPTVKNTKLSAVFQIKLSITCLTSAIFRCKSSSFNRPSEKLVLLKLTA